jgi:hypothetical protein
MEDHVVRRQYLLVTWAINLGCASPPSPSSPPPSTSAAPDVSITMGTRAAPSTGPAELAPITLGWRRPGTSGIDVFQKLQSGEIRTGMTRDEIVRVLKHAPTSTETYGDGDWHFEAEVNGLRGAWSFEAASGRLARLSFEEHRAVDEEAPGGATPAAHERAKKDVATKARATMNDLTLLFGRPSRVREGGRVHEGDTSAFASRYVLDVRWSTPSQRVKLSAITDWGQGELAIVTRIVIAPLAVSEDDD